MMISMNWLSSERIDALIQGLENGDLMDFGYCLKEKEFTPAIFEASILKNARAVCGLCGLSNNVHSDQHYPGYSVWVEMSAECMEKLVALGLDTIEGQKRWLHGRVKGQYDEVEQEMRQLMDRVREFADEKRYLAEAMRFLGENS